uniref:Putative acetyltransferase n=2 Tax=Noccaea caerulescens TaxID=107243 RepID=A0A1J3K7L4_NOCCA
MKDGVFISFGYNHMVAAGDSIGNFLSAWSKIFSNGQRENLHQPLILRGWFLDGIDFPIHIPVSRIETKTATSETSTKERVFHFTKKNIYDLKAKVNDEIGSSDQEVSSLQTVSAHIWRSITKHSGLNREEVARCIVGVDLRQTVNPRPEKECFRRNVIYGAVATATVKELQDRGLGWAALQINKMLRSLTNEDYRTAGKMAGNSIVLSGSPWFEVYDNNFGWGRPIAARPGPGNSISGKLVLYRGIEDGSIDIHATLFSDILLSLLVDVEFMEYVTVT